MDAITHDQRLYIRALLRRCELTTDRFTFMHRGPWKDAGLPEPPFDGDTEASLRTLSKTQASALIRALRSRAGEDDDGDDEPGGTD